MRGFEYVGRIEHLASWTAGVVLDEKRANAEAGDIICVRAPGSQAFRAGAARVSVFEDQHPRNLFVVGRFQESIPSVAVGDDVFVARAIGEAIFNREAGAKDMKNEFQIHALNETGLAKATELAEAFSALVEKVEQLVPKSRELSLIVTKLQEACFFAKRGIAVLPENQE